MEGKGFAVVFDLDGTLLDSTGAKIKNYLKAFEKVFGYDVAKRAIIIESCTRILGANRFIQLADTLKRLEMSASDKEKEEWSRLYSSLNKKDLSNIPEFSSVRPILEKLVRKGYKLFAASSILDKEFVSELKRRRLFNHFLSVKGGDKEGFLLSLKKMGYSPILFVGDTSYDEETAKKTGALFFKVGTDEKLKKVLDFLADIPQAAVD